MPWDRGDVLAAVHREGHVISQTSEEDGMRLHARLEPASVGALRQFVVTQPLVTQTSRVTTSSTTAGNPRGSVMSGFVPPPYPYDRLNDLREIARQRFGAVLDCSIGTPMDAPPAAVVEALASSNAERGYPPSVGTPAYRTAAVGLVAKSGGRDG